MILFLPETIILLTALLILVADLFLSEKGRRALAPLTALGILAAGVALIGWVLQIDSALGGRFGMDPLTWWFKIFFLLTAGLTVLLSMNLLDGDALVRARGIGSRGEYYTVLLLTLSGMMFLVSARDIATLYVSLELATIPLFALAAWKRGDIKSGEAGLKYVILGALASAFVLYGLGLLYGLSGTMDLDQMRVALKDVSNPAFWLAVGMTLAGIGFKLTLVPFHLWAADVYEGAPTPVTAYLSVASKAAGLAFMIQLFYRGMGTHMADWTPLLAGLAAITMTLGNLIAIVQQNIKRFMAFSAISQAGYILLGFMGAAPEGMPAMLFYMLVYITTNLAVFAGIVWMSNQTGCERIEDYRGLSRTNPMMSLAMMLGLFSLAGVPPLSGFVGKFFLFSIAAKAGYYWLVAVAALNSTISLYYYLRVVRQMYIEPVKENAAPIPVSYSIGFLAAVLSASTLVFGIIPYFYERIHADTILWVEQLMQ